MTTKTDFTPEEWESLLAAPVAGSMYIVFASPSVFGSVKEMMSLSKGIAKAVTRPENTELMRFMLSDYADKDTLKKATPKFKGSPDEIKTLIQTTVQNAVTLLDEKAAPEESQQIRQWIYDLAVQTAEAAKEGGFLGIGAVRVNEAEKQALAELSDILQLGESREGAAAE